MTNSMIYDSISSETILKHFKCKIPNLSFKKKCISFYI